MCRVAGGNRTPRLDRRCCQPAVNHVPWHRFGCRQARDSPDRASFLDELDLRRGTPEEPRQVGEVKDAAGQPNQAEQFRLTVEMEKQVDIHDGPNGRKDDVGATVSLSAISPTAPDRRILIAGVWNLGWM